MTGEAWREVGGEGAGAGAQGAAGLVSAPDAPLLLLVHGPNLNLLGERRPEVYGRDTLPDIEADVAAAANARGATVLSFQSNHEGALIDFLHEHRRRASGVILNAGGLHAHLDRPPRRARSGRPARRRGAPLERARA